jgi:hypothetical protein
MVVERPTPTKANPQHLCLDEAYDNPTGEEAVHKQVIFAASVKRNWTQRERKNIKPVAGW